MLLLLAFPPFSVPYIACLALIPLALAVRPEVEGASVAAAGLAFGAVFFGVQLHWISTVLAPETPLHLAAFVGAVLILALISGGGANAAWKLARRGVHPALAFGLAFTGVEWLRGHLGPLALPWLGVGVSTTAVPILPLAGWVGERGLTLLLTTSAGLLAHAVAASPTRKWRGRVAPAALALTLVGLPHILASSLGPNVDEGAVQLAVVSTAFGTVGQVGVEDRLLWIERALDGAAGGSLAAVVFPEATLPVPLERRPDFVRRLSTLSRRLGAPMILGAYGVTDDGVFNSTFLVGPGGIVDRSDKRHRVAIVESGFGVGEPKVLDGSTLSFGPMICFESLFSDVARTLTRNGADVLLNPTSESWFALARDAIPDQHREHLRVRAAESGRWVVRAANDGESLAIDPQGGLVWRSAGPGVDLVPVKSLTTRTLYVALGDVWGWIAGVATLTVLLAGAFPARLRSVTAPSRRHPSR